MSKFDFLIKRINEMERYYLPVLILLFVFLNSLLYWKLGIKVVADSPRYLGYAKQIVEQGFYFDPQEFWYLSYTLLLIVVQYIHPSLEAVVLVQYVLSLLGLVSLYFAGKHLFGTSLAGFISGLLYVGFFEISIYNSYILCESLYISLTAISMLVLVHWYKKSYPTWTLLLGPFILMATFFAKPTGMGLLAGILTIVILRAFTKMPNLLWKIAIGSLLIIPFFLLINKMLTTYGFMNDYQRGELIFGMFQYPNSPFYDILTIDKPESIYFPNESYPPLIRLILFIVHHPIYWLKLFFGKLFLFFLHVRPFWSTWHNIYSILFLVPVYAFFIKGLFFGKATWEIKLFSIAFIGFHALSVGMLTDDWDGRFLLPILPLIFLFVGKGFIGFNRKKQL